MQHLSIHLCIFLLSLFCVAEDKKDLAWLTGTLVDQSGNPRRCRMRW
jgi:hypothetical protein